MKVNIVSLIRFITSYRQAFFVVLLGISIPLLVQADEGVRVFVETDDSLVVMQDMTIPPGRTFEHIVLLNGHLVFAAKTKTMTVVNGSLQLEPPAEITEKLVLVSGSVSQADGVKSPPAVGSGAVSDWASGEAREWWSTAQDKWLAFKEKIESGNLLGFLALPFAALVMIALIIILAAVGVVLFFLAPSLSYRADQILRQSPFLSILWGVAGYIAVMPVLILMLISIIGILVIPFYVIFVLLVAFAGLFAGCRGLGMFILERLGLSNMALATFVGLLIVFASLWAPLIGNFFFSLVWIAGTGALLRSFFANTFDSRFVNVEFRSRNV